MYAGHLALGLAVKSWFPDVPAAPIIMVGAGLRDIFNGTFIALEIDRLTLNQASGPYMYADLTFVDGDHSLLMAIIWSLIWGAFYIKNNKIFRDEWRQANEFFANWMNTEDHLLSVTKTFRLEEIVQAHQWFEDQHSIGKITVVMEE